MTMTFTQPGIGQGLLRRLLDPISPQQVRRAAAQGIFISYTRADELFAFELSNDLRADGLNIWVDLIDVPDDADWGESITSALERCGLMVAIFSESALADADLMAEQRRFTETGKIVIPVLRQSCDVEAHTLWYPPLDFRSSYQRALRQLLRLLQPHI
ncbi:MAG: toll/interleukin-1 receptor domain-containing protein [Burkholderiales bacterium]|nr:toll/interleukin-1 receptor domain-containing protein [Anaerolineae bacterium]